MDKILIALQTIFSHLIDNASNYFLIIGLGLVLRYLFIVYGVDIFLLALGVLFIAYSLIIEISTKKSKKNRY